MLLLLAVILALVTVCYLRDRRRERAPVREVMSRIVAQELADERAAALRRKNRFRELLNNQRDDNANVDSSQDN